MGMQLILSVGRRAFTLVEVLVGLAIVAVLAAIVSAVGMRAFRSAKETRCLNNLAQLERAWSLYEADHDGWSPPLPIAKAATSDGPAAFIAGLTPYVKSRDLWFCPLDAWAGTRHQGEWHSHERLSYTVSLDLLVLARPVFGDLIHVNRSSLADPSGIVLLYDQPELRMDEGGSRVRISAHGKHAMAVFADGHAKRYELPRP